MGLAETTKIPLQLQSFFLITTTNIRAALISNKGTGIVDEICTRSVVLLSLHVLQLLTFHVPHAIHSPSSVVAIWSSNLPSYHQGKRILESVLLHSRNAVASSAFSQHVSHCNDVAEVSGWDCRQKSFQSEMLSNHQKKQPQKHINIYY